MKNYKVYFVSITFVVATMFGSLGYAGTVTRTFTKELGCAQSPKRPKAFRLRAKSDTTYSVTTNGIRLDDGEEIFPKTQLDYIGVFSESAVRTKLMLSELGLDFQPTIRAQCSSVSQSTDMWPGGTTLTCNKGDRLTVALYAPVCSMRGENQRVVFTVTETKDVPEKKIPVTLSSELPTQSKIGLDSDVGLKKSSLLLGGLVDGFGSL